MCITFFYINPTPKRGEFSLVLIMNRDEDMKRPTNQAEWKDGILAGRDMEPGKGDWLKNYVMLALTCIKLKVYILGYDRDKVLTFMKTIPKLVIYSLKKITGHGMCKYTPFDT